MKKFTKKEIGNIDGGRTALALCGYIPFGDCNSLRIRLHDTRARIESLTRLIKENESEPIVQDIVNTWKRELSILKHAVEEGEKLLKGKLKNNEEVFRRVFLLSRERVIKLLENVSIQCYDHETDNILKEALFVNIQNGTIDEDLL